MPLVMMCGGPCSGKTSRALELKAYLESLQPSVDASASSASANEQESREKQQWPKFTVAHITLESIGMSRQAAYSDNKGEKQVHSAMRAAVERALSSQVVVICDSLNHIKGLRYELHCRAREAGTPHCVVFCDSDKEQCAEWNAALEEDAPERWDAKLLGDLHDRLERPDGKRRWDKPLFTVKPRRRKQQDQQKNEDDESKSESAPGDNDNDDDDDASASVLPVEEIARFLLLGTAPSPSFATIQRLSSDTSKLYELDRVTQDVVKAIVEAQNLSMPGDALQVPYTKSTLVLNRRVAMAELRRLSRQFITIAKMRPFASAERAAHYFVDYLNTNI